MGDILLTWESNTQNVIHQNIIIRTGVPIVVKKSHGMLITIKVVMYQGKLSLI